ncbi:Penicillin-binding protein [Lentibacillus sp. JNUCC-1]|uniref:penicillin-binding transpeptidase domain-containing protein n=1 Tax=Lentibacillus sp. JNUCC-1 TaxID=2654513 RepID=UPI0012E7003C|nr:penicillin-binding transpeptidase domain-containing protein [Lentibacillus sp. JNUCC-1]MUV39039.1 Penicillin-binding protein [Lentibacillus sp. JNUCC-1]
MTRKIVWAVLLGLLILGACSNDEPSPNERFETFVDSWQNQDFDKMYQLQATQPTDAYEPTDKEAFIDRYKKIYKDINVEDLEISYSSLKEEKLEKAIDDGEAVYPFSVKMNTVAGGIDFEYTATLVQEGEEDEKNWFVQWNPGFIFPDLKDGGEIAINTTNPERGDIVDRNQIPLALNDEVYEVGIVPGKFDNNDATIKKVADLLTMDADKIKNKLNQDWVQPDYFVPLKNIMKTDSNKDALLSIGGIQFDNALGRVYPLDEAAAHLIGYVGQVTAEEIENHKDRQYNPNDIIGKRGIEQLFEEKLRGEAGIQLQIIKESDEDVMLAEKPVKDGENVVLTIDGSLQKKIYESFDNESGTAAAIHPKTGEALALVSSPAFNPNDMAAGLPYSMVQEMENDPKLPLINKFNATYSPGSTIKPLTAAIGIKNGTLDRNEGIKINGLTWSNGEGWGDYKVKRVSESNEPVDLTNALVRSDNIYFAMQAVDMGSEALVSGFESFGFGEDVPFSYPIQTSTISSDGKIKDEVMLANTGYGQGQLQISALHLALSYTPFLNEGDMLKPVLLSDEDKEQIWKEDVVSKDVAKQMQEDLRKVVAEGTANAAQRDNVAIAGKTGTAELKLSSEDKDGQENGWFVGYTADQKDLLIAMMIEHTEDKGGSAYTAEKVGELIGEVK